MKVLRFKMNLHENEQAEKNSSFGYELKTIDDSSQYDLTKDGALMAIRRLELLRDHKTVISVSNQSEIEIAGKITINRRRGVCDIIDGLIPMYCKFYIADRFTNGTGNSVFPVDGWSDTNVLWQNPLRWEYVDHMLSELKMLLKEWDN